MPRWRSGRSCAFDTRCFKVIGNVTAVDDGCDNRLFPYNADTESHRSGSA